MKEFVSKWSNWWILNPKRKQLDDAFEKELNELIEREVALRQPPVIGSVCDECGDGSGWYGCEDITYNCSKCNPEAK